MIGLAALGAGAWAATVRASGSTIVVNEVEVLKLRSSAGGRTPSQRAEYLASILPNSSGTAVEMATAGKAVRIVVDGRPWLLVTSDEAKAAGATPRALAESWSSRLKSALALPGIKLDTKQVKAPVGAFRSFSIVGSHVQESQVSVSDEKVVKALRSGRSLTIQAVGAGVAQVALKSGSDVASLEVKVEPLAAQFPQNVTAYVTGVPATREAVAGAIESAIHNTLRGVDGRTFSFAAPGAGEIPTGESRTYQVRVRAVGPQAYPSVGTASVTVKNSAVGYKGETELWYSNDPEPVKKPMRLFAAGLKPNEPARMLYHHINVSSGRLIFKVEAINNTNTPAKLLIIPGDAQPQSNPVAAGFEAADRFLRSWSKYSGEIVEIPPYSILPISLRSVGRKETVSGLCYLRLMEGGSESLVVRVEASTPWVMDSTWKAALSSSTPWRVGGFKRIGDLASVPMPDSVHIYPHPFKEEDVAYRVGGPYGFVRIGQRPIARQDNQGALDGNFGVVYRINASVTNSTSSPADVEVVYEASAGYGGALFVINGDMRRTPVLQPKQETRLSRFRIEPNSIRTLQITTVPLSGSAYPCTLTIRPVQRSTALKT